MTDTARVIRDLFDAVERRDGRAMLAAYAPDVEIHEPAGLPYGGVYTGHDGARRHAEAYLATWGPHQPEPLPLDLEIVGAEAEHVTARWRQRAVSERAGALDLPALSVYRLRDGLIVRSQMFQDTAEVARFLAAASGPGDAPTRTLQITSVVVDNPALFGAYAERALPLVTAHGGELLAYSTGRPDVVEGEWRLGRMFVHAWPSKQRFDAFYASPEYTEVRRLRTEGAQTDLAVFDAAAPPRSRRTPA